MTASIADVTSQTVKGAKRHFRGWGGVGILLLVLSVFFQSYVAQTHIHGSRSGFTEISAQAESQAPLSQGEDDHANCLLCQAVLHAGVGVVPVVLPVLLPVLLLLGLVQASRSRISLPVLASHGWRSRAPPRS